MTEASKVVLVSDGVEKSFNLFCGQDLETLLCSRILLNDNDQTAKVETQTRGAKMTTENAKDEMWHCVLNYYSSQKEYYESIADILKDEYEKIYGISEMTVNLNFSNGECSNALINGMNFSAGQK